MSFQWHLNGSHFASQDLALTPSNWKQNLCYLGLGIESWFFSVLVSSRGPFWEPFCCNDEGPGRSKLIFLELGGSDDVFLVTGSFWGCFSGEFKPILGSLEVALMLFFRRHLFVCVVQIAHSL